MSSHDNPQLQPRHVSTEDLDDEGRADSGQQEHLPAARFEVAQGVIQAYLRACVCACVFACVQPRSRAAATTRLEKARYSSKVGC